MRRRECLNYLIEQISHFEQEGEARAIAYLVMEELFGVTKRDLILSGEREIEESERLDSVIAQLASGRPIQYITGRAHFYGRTFGVSPDVLIPRGETEELVREALGCCTSGRVLDIGTGSGAIAITLALESSGLQVEGCDISGGALRVAAENSSRLGAKINLFHCDILQDDIDTGYDMIISNPPYICDSERAAMSGKVYDHEPLTALFVGDDDPLIFYREIALRATKSLSSGGWLLFEINEALGAEMVAMLESMGFKDVSLLKDLSGRDRITRCQRR